MIVRGSQAGEKRRGALRVGSAVLLAVLTGAVSNAFGQEPAVASAAETTGPRSAPADASAREEARLRFDRGLALYDAGDLVGARLEFQRAYELTGHPMVLYNLALVQAALGLSAEAVASLEALRDARFPSLGPDKTRRAQQVLTEQLERVGELALELKVEAAVVQIDNVDVAMAPGSVLRLTAGSHLLSVSAPGYEPRRQQVTITGGVRETRAIELVPLEGALARLTVSTNVPDVEVLAGGEFIGRTPFAASLAFKPSELEFELRREGYETVRRRVVLHQGSEGKLEVKLTPSPARLGTTGELVLALSEPNAVVTIDGEPTLDYAQGVSLPSGRHLLRVERAGFYPIDREVVVAEGSYTLNLKLLPTPSYLREYVDSAESARTWSTIALGTGALFALAGGGFLVWNSGQKKDAERAFDAFADSVDRNTCDDLCEDTLNILLEDLEAKQDRDLYGWLSLGVGAAGLGAGLVIYAVGDDPDRYEPDPESDVFGALTFRATSGGLALSGRF